MILTLQHKRERTVPEAMIAMLLALITLSSCEKAGDIPGILLSDPAADRPRVVNSSPLPGQNAVELNIPIFVEFDRKMDERSVEDSFSLTGSASAPGEYQWVGNRVYFVTDEPLSPGANYELTVRGTATDEEGARLEIPYYLSFFAGSRIDAPELLTMTPAPNAQNAAPDTAIELVFSRSMDPTTTEEAFRIAPSVDGTTTWEDSNTKLVFLPYAPLAVGQSYSVTVTTQATDDEGILLSNQFSATFQVGDDFQPPSIVNLFESGNPTALSASQTGISKDSGFRVVFDETMHYSNARNATSLRERDSGAAINGTYSWNGDFTELTFTPSEPLEPDTEYRFRVGTGATDEAGNAIQNIYTLDFTVDDSAGAINSTHLRLVEVRKVHPLTTELISTDPADISPVTLPGPVGAGWTAEFEFEFSHDLDAGTVLPENLTISKVAGPYPSSVYIESIQFLGTGALTNNVVRLEISELHPNLYRLRLYGARSGIESETAPGESSTWMEENTVIYFQPEVN